MITRFIAVAAAGKQTREPDGKYQRPECEVPFQGSRMMGASTRPSGRTPVRIAVAICSIVQLPIPVSLSGVRLRPTTTLPSGRGNPTSDPDRKRLASGFPRKYLAYDSRCSRRCARDTFHARLAHLRPAPPEAASQCRHGCYRNETALTQHTARMHRCLHLTCTAICTGSHYMEVSRRTEELRR
jgi:hypothetical protein